MRLAIAGADGASRLVDFDSMPSDADLDEVAASFGASAAPAAASASSDPGLVGRLRDQLSGVETAVRALRANGGDPTAAYPKPLAHYLGAMQETADALQRAQAVPAPSPTPASSPSPTAPSTPPVDRGLVDRLHAQLANAEAGLRAWRDYKAKRGPMPTLDRGPNYYLGAMLETTAALQRAQSTTSQGASDDAPSNSTSLLLNPAGTKAPPAPRGRVRDVPLGSVPPPQDPAVASVADLVRDPLGFVQRAGEPGDGTGVLAPDSPVLHARNVAANVADMPFDLGAFYATVTGGGRQVPINQTSTLAGARQLRFGRDKAAAYVAVALGKIASVGPDYGDPNAPPLSAHDRAVIANLQNPKSAAFGDVRALVRGGNVAGAPMSTYDAARAQGYSPQASAIAQGDPSVEGANSWGLYTRALGRANALGIVRTLGADQRPDSEVTPAEHAIGMVADLLSTAGMGSVGAAVSEAAPVAAMRSLVGRSAAKLVPDVVAGAGTRLATTTVARAVSKGLERIATSVPGRIGSKLITTVGENQAFAVPTTVTQAGDLTAQGNGKGFLGNLGDTATQGAAGVLRSFDPTTIFDQGAAPEARMQAALNLGLVMFGAGLEGYGWAASRARETGMDPRAVQELLDKGRQESVRRGMGQTDRGAGPMPGAATNLPFQTDPDGPTAPTSPLLTRRPAGEAANAGSPKVEGTGTGSVQGRVNEGETTDASVDATGSTPPAAAALGPAGRFAESALADRKRQGEPHQEGRLAPELAAELEAKGEAGLAGAGAFWTPDTVRHIQHNHGQGAMGVRPEDYDLIAGILADPQTRVDVSKEDSGRPNTSIVAEAYDSAGTKLHMAFDVHRTADGPRLELKTLVHEGSARYRDPAPGEVRNIPGRRAVAAPFDGEVAASDPYRIGGQDLDTPADPVVIDGRKFARTQSGPRKTSQQYARATDALLGEHRNAETGWIVDTTAKSLRSERFNAHTAEAIGELPEVVRKARRVETYDSGPGDNNHAIRHVFATPLMIDGEPYVATLDVREEKVGGRKSVHRIEAVDVRKAGGTNAGPEGLSGSAPLARTHILRDFLGDHRFSDGSPVVPPDDEPPSPPAEPGPGAPKGGGGAAGVREAQIAEALRAPVEGRPDYPANVGRKAWEAELAKAVRAGAITEARAADARARWRSRAGAWARRTGGTLDAFYRRLAPEIRIVAEGEAGPEAEGAATKAAAIGESTPGVQQAIDVDTMLRGNEKTSGKAAERFVGSFVPQAVQEVARRTDPVKRDDGGFIPSLMATSPGLRELLPEKRAQKGKK